MDRNFLLAFLLSTIAIVVYFYFFPTPTPDTQKKKETTEIVAEKEKESLPTAVKMVKGAETDQPVVREVVDVPRKTINIESDLYTIEMDSKDGVLKRFMLKDYLYTLEPHFNVQKFFISLFTGNEEKAQPYVPGRLVNMAGDISENNKIWKTFTSNEETVNYNVSNENIQLKQSPETLKLNAVLPSGLEEYKTITFYPDSYMIDMEIRYVNRTGEPQRIAPKVNFGAGNEAIDRESLPHAKLGVSFIDDDFEKYDGDDVENTLKITKSRWIGVMDKYFINVVKTSDNSELNGEMSPLDSILDGADVKVPKFVYVDKPVRLDNNQEYSRKFKLYIGPKVQSKLEEFDIKLTAAMDLGWFDVLAHPLLAILRWLQGYVVNWGVAIILLTIIVRTAMFPLAFKSMTSMNKMKLLNPQITEIREKYKKNKERMNQEIMKFYSQNKVNPVGGCLPMMLQIPIFIALYQALLPAIELRHKPFVFWLTDLSTSDYTLVLPILMGVSMFVQQSLAPMTPTMDATQAKIMKWMPVMMVLFFLNMPSGLVLYWVISNIISVGQQFVFNKVLPSAPAEAGEKAKGKSTVTPKSKTKSKGKK